MYGFMFTLSVPSAVNPCWGDRIHVKGCFLTLERNFSIALVSCSVRGHHATIDGHSLYAVVRNDAALVIKALDNW
jgi:hypothetical protein